MGIDQRAIDEVLEFVWAKREEGENSIAKLLCVDEIKRTGGDRQTIDYMADLGLVVTDGDKITLTELGEKGAEGIVRRHRLAERLLTDVLEVEDDEILETHACSFEHSLSPVVTDSICTLLGHPPTCPHGLAIPKGECCIKAASEIAPLVRPLTEAPVGLNVRIVYIVPTVTKRIDKLGNMGLVPGSIVKLIQKKPAFVIEIGETTLALDPDIVKEVYVR
ncbi:MAG: metal-dependent transcriptional regulator [Deltaproteobacteria bacterium]|nr:metal-dependent transcriptional regulator [Deltaproteobacteria bacterium]